MVNPIKIPLNHIKSHKIIIKSQSNPIKIGESHDIPCMVTAAPCQRWCGGLAGLSINVGTIAGWFISWKIASINEWWTGVALFQETFIFGIYPYLDYLDSFTFYWIFQRMKCTERPYLVETNNLGFTTLAGVPMVPCQDPLVRVGSCEARWLCILGTRCLRSTWFDGDQMAGSRFPVVWWLHFMILYVSCSCCVWWFIYIHGYRYDTVCYCIYDWVCLLLC